MPQNWLIRMVPLDIYMTIAYLHIRPYFGPPNEQKTQFSWEGCSKIHTSAMYFRLQFISFFRVDLGVSGGPKCLQNLVSELGIWGTTRIRRLIRMVPQASSGDTTAYPNDAPQNWAKRHARSPSFWLQNGPVGHLRPPKSRYVRK